jgi:hypothetical protein
MTHSGGQVWYMSLGVYQQYYSTREIVGEHHLFRLADVAIDGFVCDKIASRKNG